MKALVADLAGGARDGDFAPVDLQGAFAFHEWNRVGIAIDVGFPLEHRWNEALERVDQVKQQYADFRQREALSLTPEQKQQALALAKDLPRLWQAPSTQAKDRKRILRLLIKDITVEKVAPKKILLHLRWQGGTCEDLAVELPPNIADRLRYPSPIVEKVRQLAASVGDTEIAAALNQEGLLSAKGKPFTASIIKWLRYKHGIPTPELKHKDELTVKEVAHKFGVNSGVVYYWIAHGVLTARRIESRFSVLDHSRSRETTGTQRMGWKIE